jgi:hypothetical protein
MIERQSELKRRHHRKLKMRKLKAKLEGAAGEDRAKILAKINRLSPWWTEASLTQKAYTEKTTGEKKERAPRSKAPSGPTGPRGPKKA